MCFFDSGLEYPKTLNSLHQIEDHYAIDITVYPAQPGLLDILAATGEWDQTAPTTLAGPSIQTACIDRPAAQARDEGTLWGLRADESAGRQALFASALARPCGCCRTPTEHALRHGGHASRAGIPHYSPVWDWTTWEIWAYIRRHHLPVNPVYDKLVSLGVPERDRRVSHFLDATGIEHGRAAWLHRGWPEMWAQLTNALPRFKEYS